MRYVALLRGINVGGKNKVAMTDLKECFERLGFTNVQTYINSGNIIFNSSKRLGRTSLEKNLANRFGFGINCIILRAENLKKISQDIPSGWQNNSNTKCDVIFLSEKLAVEDVKKALPPVKNVDEVIESTQSLIWRTQRQSLHKTGLRAIFGTVIYQNVTIRNCNTVRKLMALLG